MRILADLPPALADQHTLIAQRYAGYFLGHPYRAAQQRVGPGALQIEERAWIEPAVVADDCDFCSHLSDEEAARRVAGYQHAIDIEVLRPHSLAYAEWLGTGGEVFEEINVGGVTKKRGVTANQKNRRRFIELHGETFKERALPMVALPLRLKRKLCIEWNHLYRDWMRHHPDVQYDFDAHEFYREVEEPKGRRTDTADEWWQAYAPVNPLRRRYG